MTFNPNFGEKFICDPVYGEIRLNWIELLMIDQLIFQRLRRLLQMQGTYQVYPSSSHTRFTHALGVMHLAGEYAAAIRESREDPRQILVLRIAGLLHDIGHGVFSHVYDDAVYPAVFPKEYEAGEKMGHDVQKRRIASSFLPRELAIAYENLSAAKRKVIAIELKECGFGSPDHDSEAVFGLLLAEVVNLWGKEGTADPYFNMIQGPLGADRLDFMLRDSHFSGSPFGHKVDYKRIISHASIALDPDSKAKVLCYSIRVFGSIFSFLSSKFLMYNNVAYHKTGRAMDTMVKELLIASIEPLNLINRTLDINEFQYIDEYTFFGEALGVPELKPLVRDLLARQLLKVVDQKYATIGPQQDSDFSSAELREADVAMLKLLAEKRRDQLQLEFSEKTGGRKLKLSQDSPFEMRIAHPDELKSVRILLKDDSVVSFSRACKEAGYDPTMPKEIRLWRLYASQADREMLRSLGLLTLTSRDTDEGWVDTRR